MWAFPGRKTRGLFQKWKITTCNSFFPSPCEKRAKDINKRNTLQSSSEVGHLGELTKQKAFCEGKGKYARNEGANQGIKGQSYSEKLWKKDSKSPNSSVTFQPSPPLLETSIPHCKQEVMTKSTQYWIRRNNFKASQKVHSILLKGQKNKRKQISRICYYSNFL